ncbi:MAG: imidazole glycerol phosphate synthase, glutamine amidotransferase subunit, partial [Candidatus Sungbacteria bacterium RIFCSPLOWO2_02_FULL_54_10]
MANALAKLGVSFEIVARAEELAGAEKVILPGVGAAGSAMKALQERGFADVLPKLTVPVLGICLGLQVFADASEEDDAKCLSVIPGRVKRFRTELKVPHMGWNKVKLLKDSLLTRGIPDESFFYFVHSFYPVVDTEFAIGQTTYDVDFTAIAQKNNFYGVQF